MNAFESGERKMIPAVLIYARRNDLVLMIEKSKWNGLGGKLEPGESAQEAASREFYEESGILIPPQEFKRAGILHFPAFNAEKNQDWLVNVFTVEINETQFKQPLPIHPTEGRLHWIPENQILSLPLWEGDVHFFPHVFLGKPFYGTFWYEKGLLNRWELEFI